MNLQAGETIWSLRLDTLSPRYSAARSILKLKNGLGYRIIGSFEELGTSGTGPGRSRLPCTLNIDSIGIVSHTQAISIVQKD